MDLEILSVKLDLLAHGIILFPVILLQITFRQFLFQLCDLNLIFVPLLPQTDILQAQKLALVFLLVILNNH